MPPKKSSKSRKSGKGAAKTAAVEIGKELAAAALQHGDRARKTREAALKKLPVPKGGKGHAKSAGVLIAEGDSWFDYPLHDVLSELEDRHGYDVESVAHKGDTVEDMAYSGGQLVDFVRRVDKVLRSGTVPRAVLLSGGGNDVAGEEFSVLLNHAQSRQRGLNESVLAGVIDLRVREAYITILGAITHVCRSRLGKTVPILVHGYDYPVADGRGFLGGWGPLPGPWLEPGFRRKGYSLAERATICKQMIDRFNEMLIGLAGKAPFGHVQHVDLRGTLSPASNYKTWWANELHPTAKGFQAVTAKFAQKL